MRITASNGADNMFWFFRASRNSHEQILNQRDYPHLRWIRVPHPHDIFRATTTPGCRKGNMRNHNERGNLVVKLTRARLPAVLQCHRRSDVNPFGTVRSDRGKEHGDQLFRSVACHLAQSCSPGTSLGVQATLGNHSSSATVCSTAPSMRQV